MESAFGFVIGGRLSLELEGVVDGYTGHYNIMYDEMLVMNQCLMGLLFLDFLFFFVFFNDFLLLIKFYFSYCCFLCY